MTLFFIISLIFCFSESSIFILNIDIFINSLSIPVPINLLILLNRLQPNLVTVFARLRHLVVIVLWLWKIFPPKSQLLTTKNTIQSLLYFARLLNQQFYLLILKLILFFICFEIDIVLLRKWVGFAQIDFFYSVDFSLNLRLYQIIKDLTSFDNYW